MTDGPYKYKAMNDASRVAREILGGASSRGGRSSKAIELLLDEGGEGNDMERRDLDACEIADAEGWGPREDEGPADWADRMRVELRDGCIGCGKVLVVPEENKPYWCGECVTSGRMKTGCVAELSSVLSSDDRYDDWPVCPKCLAPDGQCGPDCLAGEVDYGPALDRLAADVRAEGEASTRSLVDVVKETCAHIVKHAESYALSWEDPWCRGKWEAFQQAHSMVIAHAGLPYGTVPDFPLEVRRSDGASSDPPSKLEVIEKFARDNPRASMGQLLDVFFGGAK